MCETITSGIVPPSAFSSPDLYIRLMFAVLAGSFLWLALATYFQLPVSTTHSLIGSLVGMTIWLDRYVYLNRTTLQWLVCSWVCSPLLAGVLAWLLFSLLSRFVLRAANPRAEVTRWFPAIFACTVSVFAILLMHSTTAWWHTHRMSVCLVALTSALVTLIALRSSQRLSAWAMGRTTFHQSFWSAPTSDVGATTSGSGGISSGGGGCGGGGGGGGNVEAAPKMSPRGSASEVALVMIVSDTGGEGPDAVEGYFVNLLIMSACAVAVAHGSNDVSNAIAPFSAMFAIHELTLEHMRKPQPNFGVAPAAFFDRSAYSVAPPTWMLVCGGLGIALGLASYGSRVMATVGEKITKLTFARGFVAQLATALIVLSATLVGMSVSTTQACV